MLGDREKPPGAGWEKGPTWDHFLVRFGGTRHPSVLLSRGGGHGILGFGTRVAIWRAKGNVGQRKEGQSKQEERLSTPTQHPPSPSPWHPMGERIKKVKMANHIDTIKALPVL